MRRKSYGKKSIWIPALGAALLLLLSGCRREMEGETLSLGIPGAESAVFTGVLEDGLGEGTLEFPGWSYQGTFRVQTKEEGPALLSGSAENFPWTLVMAGEEIAGRYTGPMENAVPMGEGRFRADNGMRFTGEIFGQNGAEGEVEDLPLTVSFQGSRYTGLYSGPVEMGIPEGGQGLEAVNAAGQRLIWEGEISAGTLSGTGHLTCDRLLTTVEGAERMGVFEGEALEGVPEGEGVFTSVDENGIVWTYRGEWKNGRMEGRGELRYEAEDHYLRTGTFTAGSYTPDWLEALSVLGTEEPYFDLTEAQREFLAAHPELWEAESRTNFYDSEYKRETDRALTLWKCYNDPDTMAEPRWMTVYSLKVLNAYSGPAFPGGPDMTRILAAERNYDKVLYILVPGTVEGIASNQWVSFIALPLTLSSYTTVLGGEHSCLVVVAGDLAITG